MGMLRVELPATGLCAVSCSDFVILPAELLKDGDAVRALAGSCEAEINALALAPSAAGLVSELQSRPGRTVWAWLARSEAAGESPVGLVVLVSAGASGSARWSISWLVVDPAFRRQGIGMALVAAAVQFAGSHGASVVHAETLEKWPAAVAFWGAARLAALEHLTTLRRSGESRETAEG